MIATVRIHHLFLVMLGLIALLVTGCGSGSTPAPPPQPTTTSTSASAVAEPTAPSPQPAGPLPAALVGEWSASTSKSGVLKLVLTADGGFRQRSGTFDWRGRATVQGARITLAGSDGKTSTENWSIDGGTLTLAGQTYLKADAGAGGALALAGSWMGMDDIYETLIFQENGTYQRQRDGGGTAGGTFQVQGDKLTLRPIGGAVTTATFSIADAILTLKTNAGSVQYVRSA